MSDEHRIIPRNDLDLNMLTTESVWGKDGVSRTLRDRLKQNIISDDDDKTRELWGILSYFTRDMRLANLDYKQTYYCEYYLNLAGDFLNEDMIEPFIISLSRVASVLELSQSKKGFLRKRLGTFTHEQHSKSDEPAKIGLMGKKKNNGD